MNAALPMTVTDEEFRDAVVRGLTQRPLHIPCRFLYDAEGSALFAQICELDEYYVTRTETALLARLAPALATLIEPGARILEFGGCTPAKARFLFDALAPSAYLPVDICAPALDASVSDLARNFPALRVYPIHADFTTAFTVPPGPGPLLGFFPGSTIGNMRRRAAISFLSRVRALLGPGGSLLSGVDLKKDVRILEAAYDDARGVTRAFILNVIARIRRELDSNLDPAWFSYRARYHARHGRMEMHLVCERDIEARVAGVEFRLARGERIHIEDSHKYAVDEFQGMARSAGYGAMQVWTDPRELFSIHLLRA